MIYGRAGIPATLPLAPSESSINPAIRSLNWGVGKLQSEFLSVLIKNWIKDMYCRKLQRGFTSSVNKTLRKHMYLGGRKFQRGFASIVYEKLIRNMYSLVKPRQEGEGPPSSSPPRGLPPPSRPQPPGRPDFRLIICIKVLISLGLIHICF